MSELTLQEYQSRLEELLQRQRNDEVVQHCRHILTYFPKNVAIYRLMGRALLGSGRYPDAGQVFRRVLGVDPADYQAHLGLSRVAQHQKQGDQAIWHLERAFEQDPNNKSLLDHMHDLYRQYRGVEQTKFQLTARAVAAQQLRAGLYAQALDTLQKALAQSPGRTDLNLLLAQVLWENGYEIEAAETALSILKTLPDCLEANRILTRLWLKEQRPSDAQRYLSRIEAIDPYAAFELAQGAPPPDNAYRIAELDYQREASRQIATGNPDWLQSLDNVDEDVDDSLDNPFADASMIAPDTAQAPAAGTGDEDWMSLMFNDGQTTAVAADSDADSADTDSWMQELDQVQSASTEKTRSISTDHLKITEDSLADLFGDDDWMSDDSDEDGDSGVIDNGLVDDDFTPVTTSGQPMTGTGLTGLLSNLGNRSTGTGLTGLLNVLEGGTAGEEPTEEEEEEDWMRAVNKPTAPLRDPFKKQTTTDLERKQAEEARLQQDEDPLAWLTGTGAELVDTPRPVTDSLSGDDSDPLAWMKQTGIEFLEDAPETMYNPTLDTLDDDRPISDPNENRPMAWMENSGIDFDGDGSPQFDWMVGDNHEAKPVKTDDLPTNQDADPLAWMRDAGIELSEAESDTGIEPEDTIKLRRKSAPIITDEPDEPHSTGKESTNALDWLGSDDQLDELLDLETMVEQGTGLLSAVDQDRQDAMTDNNDNLIPDWLSSGDNDDDSADDAGDAGLEWLSSNDDDDGEEAGMDWLRQPAASSSGSGSTASGSAGSIDNLDDLFGNLDDDASDEEDALAEDVPDWLTSASAAAIPAASTLDDDDSDAADFDFDLDDEPQTADSGMPDWLSAMSAPQTNPTAAGSMFADEFEDDDDENIAAELDWQLPDDEAEDEAASSVPDWLSSVGSSGMSNEQAVDDDLIEADVPDWLTDTGTAPVVSTVASAYSRDEALDADDNDFLTDDEEEEAAVTGDVPDWLSGIGNTGTQEPATTPSFAGMFGSDDDEDSNADADFDFSLDDDEEEAVVTSDIPDWLSGMGSTSDEEPVATPEPSFAGMFGSDDDEDSSADVDFDFSLDADEEEAAVASDVPDWLSGMGSTSNEEPTATPEPSFAGMFGSDDDEDSSADADFDFSLDADEEEAAVTSDVPDWLSGMSSSTSTEEPAATPEPSFAGMFGSDDDEDSDVAADFDFSLDDELVAGDAVADDTPNWLSGIGSNAEEPVATPEPSFAGMFGSDDDEDSDADVDFDFSLEADEEEAAVGDVPDWLAGMGSTSDEPAATPEPSFAGMFGNDDDTEADDADFNFDLDDELVAGDAISEETPDWLTAVAPPDARSDVSAASLLDEEDENALDFSWEMDDEDEDAVEIPTQAAVVTDWLSDPDQDDTEDQEATPAWLRGAAPGGNFQPSDDTEAVSAADVPDWLAAIGADNEDEYNDQPGTGIYAAQEPDAFDEEDELDWQAEPEAAQANLMGDMTDDLMVGSLEEELEPTPATNAPDWLNAMVPGLDVDYAETDEEAEVASAEPVQKAPRPDFNWLTAIVEEELAPPVSMPPAVGQPSRVQAAAGAAASGLKFAFSRPPAWLRRLRGESEASSEAASAVQSESMDEDDDLPPWLQFDSDGE